MQFIKNNKLYDTDTAKFIEKNLNIFINVILLQI